MTATIAAHAELSDAIAGALHEDVRVCTRVWEAWGYGTMSADDFTPAAEDPDLLGEVADAILAAGYRRIFDGDCGLSNIQNPTEREAAEAWMRWANLVNTGDGEPNGIAAMQQMLTEFGYRKPKVIGYVVVDRDGKFIKDFGKEDLAAQAFAAESTQDCKDTGIDWDYRVATMTEASA